MSYITELLKFPSDLVEDTSFIVQLELDFLLFRDNFDVDCVIIDFL